MGYCFSIFQLKPSLAKGEQYRNTMVNNTDNQINVDEGVSITVLARHYIKPNDLKLFQLWLEKIKNECKNFNGYLGTRLIEPIESQGDEYVTIFRFNNFENLNAWTKSNIHNELVEEINKISYSPVKITPYKGLEFWFDESDRLKKPSDLKMAILTYIGLLPLILIVPPILGSILNIEGLINIFISTAIIVLLMSYVVMPLINKIFKPFL